MKEQIYFVRAPIFFSFVLGLVFLVLCFLDRLRKKRMSLGFNFLVALIVASFLLFVTWFGLP
jgi:energy-coupling factor transporter transmembrane protein EcfT